MTCSRRALAALGLALTTGCVEQHPGIEVTVDITLGNLPAEAVETTSGPLPLVDARITIERVVLEPCPEATARRSFGAPLSWLVGTARAHGDADHAEGALTIGFGATLTAGSTLSGAVAVPARHPICHITLVPAPTASAELAVRVDGDDHRWVFPVEPLRWPIEPLTLDRGRMSATVTLDSDPARWLDPFTADGPAVDGGLPERLARGVADSMRIEVR